MATKTKNFNELRDRARKQHPNWDANVAERKRAIDDALALASGGTQIIGLSAFPGRSAERPGRLPRSPDGADRQCRAE